MRAVSIACLMALLCACGGGGSSSSTPISPTNPSGPSAWTLSGQVVTTITGQPVAGAVVTAGDLSATTDADGRFELRRPSALTGPVTASIAAGGSITRETLLASPRSSPLVVDVIADRSPFSLAFYRQLVRNAFEEPQQLRQLYRWTRDATFYLRTIEESGRAVEPEVLALVGRELPRAFAFWTSENFHATVEQGVEERPEQAGLIRVGFVRNAEPYCARATVGGNYGWMVFNVDRCGCGSIKVTPNVVWHEVGHTAGFWHVAGDHQMNRYYNLYCGDVIHVCEAERWHARVAYTRPWGNTDPDRDPSWFTMAEPGTGARPTITCP